MPQPDKSFQMSRITLAVILAVVTFSAGADPVKCVDATGKVRYIDESMMGQEKCKPVRADVQFMPAAPGAATSAKPPPPASPGSAANREASFKEAQSRLAAARNKLAEQEAIRSGDERNYARVEERLKPYQDAVRSAEEELEQARRAFR